MPRLHNPEVRLAFEAALEQTGDYREACRVAGVPERTGRRWRRQIEARGSRPSVRSASAQTAAAAPRPSATSFVGRAQDLTALTGMLERGDRLVTVFGPPGIGKTRLASELLRTAAPIRNGEVQDVFCDLRSLRSRQEVATELGRALGLKRLGAGGADEESLGAALDARGPCWVLLDNFEGVVGTASTLVAGLLKLAPNASFVVTSRVLLHLANEVAYELPPLSLPSCEPQRDPWAESAAMRLFRARAMVAEPGLRIQELAPEVATLVRRLEGIPLAIELAAAQLRSVGLGQLLVDVEDGLLGLEHLALDSDPRHRSLRNAVERSFRLLTPAQQRVFAHLSVFRKGFTAEAAAAVLDHPPGDPREVGCWLQGLRGASLLRVERYPSAMRRWDMFEAIREFGTERLADLKLEECATDRHAAYYQEFGEAQVAELSAEGGARARDSLRLELENLRAAFKTRLTQREPESILRIAAVLFETLIDSAPTGAADIATTALEAVSQREREPPAEFHVPVLIRRSIARRETNDVEGALRDAQTARAVMQRSIESWSVAHRDVVQSEIDYHLGLALFYRGLYVDARARLERALGRIAQRGDREPATQRLEGQIVCALATTRAQGFRDETALALFPKAVALLKDAHDAVGEAWARYWWAGMRHHFQRAPSVSELEAQVEHLRQRDLRVHEVHFRLLLAIRHADAGRPDVAYPQMTAVRRLCMELGLVRLRWCGSFTYGFSLEAAGSFEDAALCYEEAAKGFSRFGDRRNEALAMIYLGGVVARSGEVARAESLLQGAQAALAKSGDARAHEMVALQRGHLDLALARVAFREGRVAEGSDRLAHARERAAAARRPRTEGTVVRLPIARCSAEARMLLRMLEREIGAVSADEPGLQVSPDGDTFSLGGDGRRRLPEGALLRKLFLVLVDERLRSPGRVVSMAELIDRCWPGERMRSAAGALRVRGLIRRLRRAGLSELILTGEQGGYLLDSSIRTTWAETKPPTASRTRRGG